MPQKRILLYSHDTYGLGHLRRSLALAHSISQHIPRSRQLLVTGSPVAGAFQTPPRLETIKLPSLSKRSSGEYMPRSLPLGLQETIRWRAGMILDAVRNFEPDLVLVDKAPAGALGELLPALSWIKEQMPETRLVLGLRDIEDDPQNTRREWRSSGIYPLLEQTYDSLLLYGQRSVFDPVSAYGLSSTTAARLVECGYVCSPKVNRSPRLLRRDLGLDRQPFILVTAGGGGDGYPLLDAVMRLFETGYGPAYHPMFVTGPLMPQEKRLDLGARAAAAGLHLVEFTPDLIRYLAAADLVIGMAGYNTTCEILTHGRRALLFPRTQTRQEQRIRAERLQELGLVGMLEAEDLQPELLARAIARSLEAPGPKVELQMDGISGATRALSVLLAHPKAHDSRPANPDPSLAVGRLVPIFVPVAEEGRP